MPTPHPVCPPQVFKIECGDGCRFIVYNASAIGNPEGHEPDKWYVRPYRLPDPSGEDEEGTESGPFDSAEEAKRVTRSRHARVAESGIYFVR